MTITTVYTNNLTDPSEVANASSKDTILKILKRNGIDTPNSRAGWIYASSLLAEEASGIVTVYRGQSASSRNIFDMFEKPLLEANPKVSQIVYIDPSTNAVTGIMVFENLAPSLG